MSSKTKTIAVTGAGGFVGRRLIPELIQNGHVVHAIVRDDSDTIAGAITHVLPSYSSRQLPEILSECDTLVHLAWATTPASSQRQPVLELEGNLLPSLQLLDYLQNSPVDRVIFISSGGAVTQARGEPWIPDGTAMAHSYYGASKAAFEQYLLAFSAQFNKSVVILRPTNLYGPGQPLIPGFGLVRTILDAMLRNHTLTIWGDGSVHKDFLYIDDFISLLSQITADEAVTVKAALLEVGAGETHSINEVIKLLEIIGGTTLRCHYEPGRAIDPASVAPNLTPATQWANWSPATLLRTGLKATYEWAYAHYGSH